MTPFDISDSWSPAQLKAGYPRHIVGFDVRRDPVTSPFCSGDSQYMGTWNKIQKTCYSIDELIWPPCIDSEESRKYRNGLGFFDTQMELADFLEQVPDDKILVAFDQPDELLAVSTLVRNITPLAPDVVPADFMFAGYDVADWDGYFSAFYSFDRSIEEMQKFLTDNQIELNDVGLVSDETAAIRAAVAFTKKYHTPHGPFTPYGVWIKTSHAREQIIF